MKKENDEITDLFRTRLADAGMSVRDGFWEELSQEIPVACQHRRRILLFRVAAAASVLLVLAASSATFLYFSPKEEMEEAFTKIAVTNGGQMDGDGIRVNQLPLPVEPGVAETGSKVLRYAVTIHRGRRFAFYHFLHVVFFFCHYFYGKWQPIW